MKGNASVAMAIELCGNLVDVVHRTISPGTISIQDGCIQAIQHQPGMHYEHYILPGFVDAHVHIESSMLVPSEFARLAAVHGTVAAVSDPHEIANVLGLPGIRFMLRNAAQVPFQIAFGASSCVPATEFETAGAVLSAAEIQTLFDQDHLTYLSEVMNVPGILSGDTQVMEKIRLAHERGLPVDGHAPALRGDAVRVYAGAGILTDHECITLEEAQGKLLAGMSILIREGSAARNFAALHSLIDSNPDRCMFCSDDKHPDDLVKGHINDLVRRSVALGHDVMSVLQVACLNPVKHYGLRVGLLQVGDSADCIVVEDLDQFRVLQTYCRGQLVAKDGEALLPTASVTPINRFVATAKVPSDLFLPDNGKPVRVIEAIDGQVITSELRVPASVQKGEITADLTRDILKLVVVNRYLDALPSIALVKNFNLKQGAIASSVAHDSHNLIAVGTTDEEICRAINAVIQHQGGIAVAEGNRVEVLPLPIAGLMSAADGYTVARRYAELDTWAKQLGSTLSAPFMTLSFMALLVIPSLKLSDRGLFSADQFKFVPLWVE